jgi:8-oxo-dGTP pyrophosphatase MutT (NUDIX family)
VGKTKSGRIRPLALCIIRRGSTILVAEGRDVVKQEAFYRPLGGRIEFGEYGHQTVVRELLEEIGEAVTDLRYLGTLENVFTYNGETGHEICRVYDGVFVNEAVYQRESLEGRDDDEHLFTARWLPLEFFRRGQAPLYPDGLLDLLLAGA